MTIPTWTEPTPPNDVCSYDHITLGTPLGLVRIEWKSSKQYGDYALYIGEEWISSSYALDDAKGAAKTYLIEKLGGLQDWLLVYPKRERRWFIQNTSDTTQRWFINRWETQTTFEYMNDEVKARTTLPPLGEWVLYVEQESSMITTAITYLYRDSENYKQYEEVIVNGVLCSADINTIFQEGLDDEQGFVPSAIGLEDLQDRFSNQWADQYDHPYHELVAITPSQREATTAMTALEFRDAILTTDWDEAAEAVIAKRALAKSE